MVNSETKNQVESSWVVVGLVAIAMSTLIVEIALTKFFAYKVYHHFTYAVLSLVILGFGASGVYVYLRPKFFGQEAWSRAARYGGYYAVSLLVALLLFCWVPIDPYDQALPPAIRALSLPIYFVLFTVPFFFAGVCISYTLTASKRPVTRIYFWDLMGAAAGAALCPILLRSVGGYATFALAAAGGMLALHAFNKAAAGNASKPLRELPVWGIFAAVVVVVLWYPGFAVEKYGFDIRSSKDWYHRIPYLRDFDGIESTYWNAIARVDVSHTGYSSDPTFNGGLTPEARDTDIPGRYFLVDGGANTRQYKVTGPITEQNFIGDSLWGAPYILRNGVERTMVIGAGGGIDILVAKYFGAKEVDVAELNEATVSILTGRAVDPEKDNYLPWLVTDENTTVNVYHAEARHFATTQDAGRYDVIQASAVDTLTAISSGGMSLVENYLYTVEGVEEFMRLLTPEGILSLTHWRTRPPMHNLRMFLTYLEALERSGVKDAYRHVIVVAGPDTVMPDGSLAPDWTDTLMRLQPFTEEQGQRIRDWAVKYDRVVLFDPLRPDAPPPGIRESEQIYWELGFMSREERLQYLEDAEVHLAPVVDDKPYFYQMAKVVNIESGFLVVQRPVFYMFIVALIAAAALILLP
ncbi:MAG: hypothetical protein E2O50_04580, partial [Gammaproteobacteria bacterium]